MSEDRKPDIGKLISDFNKSEKKKAEKKENVLVSYTMKATARDQDKNILISKLQKDLRKSLDDVCLLQIENEVKEDLITMREKELETLKNENEQLKISFQQKQEATKITITEEKPFKIYNYNNNDNEVVSTFTNVIASPKNEPVLSNEAVVSTSTTPVAESTKTKSTKLKRTASKKGRENNVVPNFLYNLRKRTKQK